MQDKDKMGVIAGTVVIGGAIIGIWALMKMLMLLIPFIVVGAIVGGLIWLKNKG